MGLAMILSMSLEQILGLYAFGFQADLQTLFLKHFWYVVKDQQV